MPMPVSATVKATSSPARAEVTEMIPPSGV